MLALSLCFGLAGCSHSQDSAEKSNMEETTEITTKTTTKSTTKATTKATKKATTKATTIITTTEPESTVDISYESYFEYGAETVFTDRNAVCNIDIQVDK